MLRFDRGGWVAAVACVSLGVLGVPADAREGVRDYPHSAHCPVHTPGPSGQDDAFAFTATERKMVLTFVTCDSRSVPDPNELDDSGNPSDKGYRIGVSIDDLVIVEQSVFNKEANRLSFTDAISQFNYNYDEHCYFQDGSSEPSVQTVFKRHARYKKAAVPFREDFEGSSAGWRLRNASFDKETGDTGKSLILARAERNGQPGQSCSAASVKVRGLVPGSKYVIDFSWWVRMPDSLPTPVPALTFFIEPAAAAH